MTRSGNDEANGRWLWHLLAVGFYLLAFREGVHCSLSHDFVVLHRMGEVFCALASLFCLWRALYRPQASVAHGSAGFMSRKEQRKFLAPENAPLLPGAFLLGQVDGALIVLPPKQALQHGIIVGGSGAGKSFGYFLPNAARAQGVSCVFTDPKSELWRYTSGFHTSVRYAPGEPEASEGFNWIPLCKEPRMAELCARALVESGNTQYTEQIWIDAESSFLAALFSHTSTLPVPTPLSCYRLFTQQPQETLLAELMLSPSEVAREQAAIFAQTQEKIRGSIVPSVAARLQFMRDDAVARFTSASLTPPDFGRLRQSPRSLYWCLREADVVRLRPLTSLFFTVLLEQLVASETPESESVPILVGLEEFGNIGKLPHFETTISLARGRGIGLWLGVQSLSQLEALYDKPNARTILMNCGTKVVLSGLDLDTGEYFSRALGPKTVVTRRRNHVWRWLSTLPLSVHDSTIEHARFLLTADEIRRMETDEALVIAGNCRPMRVKKIRYEAQPHTAHTTALGEAMAMPISIPVPAAVLGKTGQKPARKKRLPPPPPALPLTYTEKKNASGEEPKQWRTKKFREG